MSSRIVLAVTFVLAGVLCIVVTLLAVVWIDNVARHERSTEIQAAIQAEAQGRSLKDLPPYSEFVSPLMTWITFGIGAYLVGTGFVLGVRSLRPGPIPVGGV